ncbi:Cytochrome p450 [Quillaja saponaria]|uniref:Cytochrome p450 n=1 Tax=Quillaja saponaria TaxID=32244 RepID=A0AAD7LML0_QUISA|nr:Cytochrome p450 [Quillaja saponaria]
MFMELHFPSSVIFAFFLFLFMLFHIFWRSKAKHSNPIRLPPGPWKLPFIGNLHQLTGPLPHQSLDALAKRYGPLMHIQLGELSNIVVSSAEMAEEVMKKHDIIFANRPPILASKILSYDSTGITFSPLGDYWRQMRKFCTTELLSTKRVESFRSIREEGVSSLITDIASNEGSSINLSEKIFSLIYGMTSRAAFGGKSKDQEEFISVMNEVTKLVAGFSIADLYPSIEVLELISGLRPKLEKQHKVIDRILQSIINEHKEKMEIGDGEGHENLLDVLLHLQNKTDLQYPITVNNIKAVILDIFSGGSETTSTTLEWAMSELLRNPRVMQEAQAECSERCEINGYEIPVKTKVIVNAWAIGRDPKNWSEAERFIPERFLNSSVDYKGADYEYIPFGAGRRICPGITFAIANIELPLANLLYHFDWKLPNGMKLEALDMTESFGLSVGRKNELCLIPNLYHFPAS